MPFGTPEQVRDTVRRMKDLLGADGGLILSPTHVLEPEVPVKNVLAFVEACRES
jgi:uroporphyrinogen decarboxylase